MGYSLEIKILYIFLFYLIQFFQISQNQGLYKHVSSNMSKISEGFVEIKVARYSSTQTTSFVSQKTFFNLNKVYM